jgi:glycosyltransferase involved in cell wall biosynthesis
LLLLVFALLFKKMKMINRIYVRNPEYAFAFSLFKKFSGPFALKFAGFHTQEALALIKGTLDKWFFVKVFERINYCSINSADLILIHSSLYEKVLRRTYDVNITKQMLIAPAGVDLKKLMKIKETLSKTTKNEDCAILKIGVVGSVTWWDGLDILLESMPYVLKSFPNVVLCYVSGIVADMGLLNNLKLRANQLGLNVEFKGPLNHEDALAEMYHLSALVLPRRRTQSTEITIPIKVKEALALGVPVIVTGHRVFHESFKDYEDLIFVQPDPVDVAEKVVMLLSDPLLAERLSNRGPELAKSFSYDLIADNFAKMLLNLN